MNEAHPDSSLADRGGNTADDINSDNARREGPGNTRFERMGGLLIGISS